VALRVDPAADLLGISPVHPRIVPPTGTPFDLRPSVTDEHLRHPLAWSADDNPEIYGTGIQ
jgi:hypothetical protein